MKRASVEQVRACYPRLGPRLDQIARELFEQVFERDPALRKLLPADLTRVRQQLTASMALVWKNLDRMAALEAPLMELGRQLGEAGVTPGHYPVFRDAMATALEKAGEEAWPAPLRDAFGDALNSVGAVMLKGAARAALDAAQHLSGESRQWDSPRSH